MFFTTKCAHSQRGAHRRHISLRLDFSDVTLNPLVASIAFTRLGLSPTGNAAMSPPAKLWTRCCPGRQRWHGDDVLPGCAKPPIFPSAGAGGWWLGDARPTWVVQLATAAVCLSSRRACLCKIDATSWSTYTDIENTHDGRDGGLSLSMEMGRLTRDGTDEPVSRDQILRHARGQENVDFPCSADHEQDWQPHPVDPYSAICDDHSYIHTHTYWKHKLLGITNWECPRAVLQT